MTSPVLHDGSESSEAVTPRKAWLSATYILIAVNVIVFYAMLIHSIHITGMQQFLDTRFAAHFDSGLLQKWGSDYGLLTLSGQYWRVITSIFLHLNIVHLAINMFFLWGLGTKLDRLLSKPTIFAIYLLTGIGGALVSLGWKPYVNSVGSSGAVYGQAGVLISFLVFGKLDLPRRNVRNILIWMIFLTPFGLFTGHPSKGVNYAAHLGGLVSGIVIGVFLAGTFRTSPEQRATRQRRVLAFAAIAMVAMFGAVIQLRSTVIKQYRDELALQKKDLVAYLIVHSQRIVSENPNDAEAHIALGDAYMLEVRADEAAAEYRRALEIDPGDSFTQERLTSAYIVLGRHDDVVPLLRESLSHGPETSGKYQQLAFELMMAGHMEEAEKAARKAVHLDSKSKSSHQMLGTILLVLGKTDEAQRERELAEQLPAPNQAN